VEDQETGDRLDRVKRALLAMQRHSWEQGVAAQAFLELGEPDITVLMAKEAVVRQREEGRLGVVGSNHAVTDPAANGEAVLYAAQATGDEALRGAAERMLDYLLHAAPRSGAGTLYHLDNKLQVWVDSMYMAPPFLAVAGYPTEAVRQIEGMRELLWLPYKGLFAHIWDEEARAFAREACWGVGNGWAAAGMARVIGALPEEMAPDRAQLAGYVIEVVDGCLAHQRHDGLFHNVVDDRSSFVEANLAQMLAYTIYRGAAGGWLDEAYVSAADRMRRAAQTKVDAYGLVRGVCGAPAFDHPGTAPEGQAFYLLMEAAYRDHSTAKQRRDSSARIGAV
jgi:rhamnogalacturonyl hydrolase YesR